MSALVRNVKNSLNNFESVYLQIKHNLFIVGHDSLSLENSESCFSINDNILCIRKKGIQNALNTVICYLNISSVRNKFVSEESIVNPF